MVRRSLVGMLFSIAVSSIAAEARAQVPFTSVNDPFFAYYSYYLPRQQALALQPGPEATIATITANRQAYAATNRNDMFDTMSPGLGDESGEFSPNGISRRSVNGGPRASRIGGNLNGLGPAGYYNSTRGYHPTVRSGISKNHNVSVTRGRSYSGGLGGGLGLPGPR